MVTGGESWSRNPYHRAETLADLLDWADVDFVRCAYVTVLGRQPDARGERNYLGQVRRGVSKLEILWQLRRSAEAQNHDPGIKGFDRALRRARWERAPIIGPLLRLVTGGEGNSAKWRQHRALFNQLERGIAAQHELGLRLEAALAGLGNADLGGSGALGTSSVTDAAQATGVASPVMAELDSLSRHALKILQKAKAVG